MSHFRTPHTETELIAIFKEKGIDEKYFDRFLTYYKRDFEGILEMYKDYNDDDFQKGESVQSLALFSITMYIDCIMKEIAKGHGDEWAFSLAKCDFYNDRSRNLVYEDLKKLNPDLAKKELLILSKSYNEDQYFEKYFINLYEDGSGYDNCANRARKYSEIFKNQLAIGKSEVYAHEFAILISDGVDDFFYADKYASSYEKAINKGKSIDSASQFAFEYVKEMRQIIKTKIINNDEELNDFNIGLINANLNAWEYNYEHKLKNFKSFAEIYEGIYLNSYFFLRVVKFMEFNEETDREILERALEKFNEL